MSRVAPLQVKSTAANDVTAARKALQRPAHKRPKGVALTRALLRELTFGNWSLGAPGFEQRAHSNAPTALDTPHAPAELLPTQMKLEVSQPGDALEQEADRVADSVIRMPSEEPVSQRPEKAGSTAHSSARVVQRACSNCTDARNGGEAVIRRSPHGLQGSRDGTIGPSWSQRLHAIRSNGGQPLSHAVRRFMEPRLGASFGDVKVHCDQTADALSREVKARAFTLGRDLVFKQGEFAPGTERGLRLIAHELTHVMQQAHPAHRALLGRSASEAANNGDATILRQDDRASGSSNDHLQSPRFANAKLERCFEDQDRLRPGDPDTDAVTRVQQALVDLKTVTGHTYELGSTGTNRDGVDGKYGPKTAAAVRQFKSDEGLGFTQYGDVGPGVMRRLDELFKAGGTTPSPTPVAPSNPRNWRLQGTTATAGTGATLGGLAQMLGRNAMDYRCIRPIRMQHALLPSNRQDPRFRTQYERFIIPGDTFDVSNLLVRSGPAIAINLVSEIQDVARAFYGARLFTGDVDLDLLATAAGADQGRTPIQDFVVVGHTTGVRMFGSSGSASSTFEPANFDPNSPPFPDFDRASRGEFPRRCWFTANATVRSVGCSSTHFGQAFSDVYLRAGSRILTTTSDIMPGCRSQLTNPQAPCTNPDGLAFVFGFPRRDIRPGGGPFFSRSSFEAARYWATIRGRL